MPREVTSKEKEVIQRLTYSLHILDKLVFPANPANIFLFMEKPSDREHEWMVRRRINPDACYIGYGEDVVKKSECYSMFCFGIDEFLARCMAKRFRLVKNGRILEKLTQDEAIVGIAAHEVRHRIQCHFPSLELLSPALPHNLLSEYVRRAIGIYKPFFEKLPKEFRTQEFDSLAIQHLAMELFHWGEGSSDNIAGLVRAGARQIRPFEGLYGISTAT